MDALKCAVCEKELKENMEVEYARFINEFFCSTECATDRYFNYMESTPVDFENTLPEDVAINDAGILVRAVEHHVHLTGEESVPLEAVSPPSLFPHLKHYPTPSTGK